MNGAIQKADRDPEVERGEGRRVSRLTANGGLQSSELRKDTWCDGLYIKNEGEGK
jgi:hypothetical protein